MRATGLIDQGRLSSRQAAFCLAALALVLAVAYVPEAVSLSGDSNFTVADSLANVVLSLSLSAAGFVVTRRQPRNPIGWLLLGAGVALMLSEVATAYAALVYPFGHRGLPFGRLAILCGLLWAPAIAFSPVAILLFPDGRLPSPRWRCVMRSYLVVAGLWIACFYVVAVRVLVGTRIAVNVAGDLTAQDNPVRGLALLMSHVEIVLQIVLAVFWLSMIGRLAVSFRRAVGVRREQLKWILSGAAVTMVATAFVIFFGSSSSAAAQTVASVGGAVATALPISVGVAIVRYRLFEIDQLISRTLAYAILSGLLAGAFLGVVALSTQVLPLSSRVGVAAATLAAAGLFNPLRVRVQRLVDRRFNRARYDAEAIVAEFAASVRDAVDLEAIRGELLSAVRRAVEPAHVSLWISGSRSRDAHADGLPLEQVPDPRVEGVPLGSDRRQDRDSAL